MSKFLDTFKKKPLKALELLLAYPFIGVIKFYQYVISPMLGQNKCRYVPTCSAYGLAAFKKYGVFKGLWLTINRLRKCHPWGGSGYDPLP